MSPAAVPRRRVLGLLGLGVAVVGGCSVAGPGTARFDPRRGEVLREPPELTSTGGRLAVDLVAGPGASVAGRPAAAWGYGGTVPGPTLRVRPGDELAVRLHNRLDRPTNLHTHGLRVSPEGNGDNPFVLVPPGAAGDYRIPVPADHPTGTFWYHPHAHGHVAEQVFAGLAGALVVADGPTPGVAADRVLVVGDTTLDAGGRPVTLGPPPMGAGRRGELLLLDGQLQPEVGAVVGEVQRWRFVNATASRTLTLALADHLLHRVAVDGITLPGPEPVTAVRLLPGARSDVLVRPDRAGRWSLTARTAADGGMGMGGAGPVDEVLATVVVGGPGGATAPFPVLAAAAPSPAGAVTVRRRLVLTGGMGGMGGMGGVGQGGMGQGGMTFGIDGRPFDPERVDQRVAAGAVEEWTVENATPMSHPFHLHTWPMELVADSAGTAPTGVAQDVVEVPAGGWARLLIAFVGVTGRSVYHCHVLDHEDAGMMGTVAVG